MTGKWTLGPLNGGLSDDEALALLDAGILGPIGPLVVRDVPPTVKHEWTVDSLPPAE